MCSSPGPQQVLSRKLISIVTPVYNEEENVEEFYRSLDDALSREKGRYDFEIIFTDNHSTDGTYSLIRSLANKDARIRMLRFSRNFGYQKSILTGYLNAKGAAAIQLDCDLQDPPALISEFLRHWEAGAAVVYGIRRAREETVFIQGARRLFYRALSWLSAYPIPPDAGDFRLIDRRVIEALRDTRDSNPYLRGRIALIGFRQYGVPYDRAARKRGVTKFSFLKLVGLAVDAIVSHSAVPLRFATVLGLFAITLSSVAGLGLIVAKLLFGQDWPTGFATLAVLILFGFGVNGLMLGIMGEYVARIYDQLKISPNTIIEEQFPDDNRK